MSLFLRQMAQQTKYKLLKEFLGGDELVKEPLNNEYDLIRLTRNGINKKQLLFLVKYLSLNLTEISKILPISIRTLQRYNKNQTLNTDVTNRSLLIAELFTKGVRVFGNLDKFNFWFRSPNSALSGHMPIDLLDTTFGLELIKDELGRIEYGVIS
jgi:putative toxin-antitoxin system antitoxin component (TIGR02293 family)